MNYIIYWFNFIANDLFRRYPTKFIGTGHLKIQTNLQEFWIYGRSFYEPI